MQMNRQQVTPCLPQLHWAVEVEMLQTLCTAIRLLSGICISFSAMLARDFAL